MRGLPKLQKPNRFVAVFVIFVGVVVAIVNVQMALNIVSTEPKSKIFVDLPLAPVRSDGGTVEVTPISLPPRKRQNKVILFGPHDRYNFGDLLFSKVLTHLLINKAGYNGDDILQGGVISINMSMYGGWDNILGPKVLQRMSRSDEVAGPYDIIYIGGESTGCNHDCATKALMMEEHRRQSKREKIYDCGYLIPKKLLRNPENKSSNYAVLNSVGGTPNGACKAPAQDADYVSFRDKEPLAPDSACMVREIFGNEIEKASKNVLKDLFGIGNATKVPDYIAVQHKVKEIKNVGLLAKALDKVSRGAGNATIIFFAAGTVPNHDSLEAYKKVASFMRQPVMVCMTTNIWEVIGLISKASAVLSTSLHVRIMAFIYSRPRLTWCPHWSKHPKFIRIWDTHDSPQCIEYNQHMKTWDVLHKYYGKNPKITQETTKKAYEIITSEYMKSFEKFSSMLANGTIG